MKTKFVAAKDLTVNHKLMMGPGWQPIVSLQIRNMKHRDTGDYVPMIIVTTNPQGMHGQEDMTFSGGTSTPCYFNDDMSVLDE